MTTADSGSVETERLDLSRPVPEDLPALFSILSDPRVWTHFPTLRHTDVSETEAAVQRWTEGWEANGLDTWVVRRRDDATPIGYGGCSVLGGEVWNLGYRLAPEAQGHGYATELARAAVVQAHRRRPDMPVIAYLLEHNTASARVAIRLGLELVHRGPDAGNPDPAATRLVYADRALTPDELHAAMR